MPRPPRIPLSVIFTVLVLFSAVAHARGGDSESDESVCKGGDGDVDSGCPLQGNGDFYGLGVRIGIYFQWLTSWLANNFLPSEIIGSLETNSIFLLALFSTVFTFSLQTRHIRVVDVLIIHQLCVGFLFSIMSLWGYRTMYYKTEGAGGRRHFGGFGTHFRLVLMSMITCYGVWFWLKGLEALTQCDQRLACGGLDTFFFASMKVRAPATRAINLVLSIGASVYYGVMTVVAAVAGLVYVARRLNGKDSRWELIAKTTDRDVALDKRELTIWYIILSSFNLFWIVFAIASIEFTINLNHMTNVVGTGGIAGAGQLLPALIGVISFVKVVYELARLHVPWLRKAEEEDGDEECCAPDAPGEEYDFSNDPGEEEEKQNGRYGMLRERNGLGLSDARSKGLYAPAPEADDPSPPPFSPFPPSAYSHSPHSSASTSTTLASHSKTAPLPRRSTHLPRRPRPKRSLAHRVLLAWLPWLNMFAWSRESLSPRGLLGGSFAAGASGERVRTRVRGAEVGREVMRMRRIDSTRLARAGERGDGAEEGEDLGEGKGFDDDTFEGD